MYEQVGEDDSVGNALCRVAAYSDDTGKKSEYYTEYDLAALGNGACDIVGSHEPCTEHKSAAAKLTCEVVKTVAT